MAKFMGVDKAGFQIHPDILGEDDEDTAQLRDMAEKALRYIQGFRWAPPVKDLYLAWGVGKVIAIFLVKFKRPIPKQPDDEAWVIVGDIPSMYLEVDPELLPNLETILECYSDFMEDWADTVLSGGDRSRCYPVEAAPTRENAELLKARVEFIREALMPATRETRPAIAGEKG